MLGLSLAFRPVDFQSLCLLGWAAQRRKLGCCAVDRAAGVAGCAMLRLVR